jgi:hypothetical protein
MQIFTAKPDWIKRITAKPLWLGNWQKAGPTNLTPAPLGTVTTNKGEWFGWCKT